MRWSRDFAYVIGLIATDGCLSKDGRHIDFTSKDLEQVKNFKRILGLDNKIGFKTSGSCNKKYYRVEFGNVKLYRYLESIGIYPSKSKTIKNIEIPDKYFPDFLRGCLDGDGYTFSYWSKQWPNSFVFYSGYVSASKEFLYWLKNKINDLYQIKGYISKGGRGSHLLKYAKYSSLKLLKILYYSKRITYLSRKKFKIEQALGIIHSVSGSGETGIHVGPRSPCR